MILSISNIRFTSPDKNLCITATLLTVMAGTAFGFPRFGWRSSGRNPVHEAATCGDTAKLTETIRESPTNASVVDARGNTPLHLTAVHNRVDAARVLLRAGAQVNATNAEGMTPLISAAKSGSLEVVKLLLRQGADTRIKDARGWSALKWAKRSHHYEIAIRIALADARR